MAAIIKRKKSNSAVYNYTDVNGESKQNIVPRTKYAKRDISKKDVYGAIFKEYPDVVSAEQMSEMLGISSKTAYRILRENTIEHFRIGRTYKIPKIHILSYLNIVKSG
jgi:excisionase family DNA binding protein